jgi:hypothetical protein
VFTSLPPRWRFQQRLYKRMIVRAFPHARHVPWAYHEGRITDSPTFEFAREVLGFARSRASRLLPRKTPAMTRWAFRDVEGLLRADPAFTGDLVAWTRSDHFDGELFDAAGLRALCDEFVAGRAPEGTGNILEHFAAIARWYRWGLLGGGGAVRVPPEADPVRFGVAPRPIADRVRAS